MKFFLLILICFCCATIVTAQTETKISTVNGIVYKVDYTISQFNWHLLEPNKGDKSLRCYDALITVYKKINGQFILIQKDIKGTWNQKSKVEDVPELWVRAALKRK